MTCAAFLYSPLAPQDRVEKELSANGVWSLFSAYRNNALDYRAFYPRHRRRARLCRSSQGTCGRRHALCFRRQRLAAGRCRAAPRMEAQRRSDSRGEPGQQPARRKHPPPQRHRRTESAVHPAHGHGNPHRAGNLRRSHLSLPPTPGSSIVRRPNCDELFSVGTVFREKGYDTAFVYGGFGYFDNMNAFFSGNGFRIVDRSDIPREEITFTNAWGVCDEDLFRAALRDADESFRQHHRSVLSVRAHHLQPSPLHLSRRQGEHSFRLRTQGRGGLHRHTPSANSSVRRRCGRGSATPVFIISGDHTSSAAGHTDLPPDRYHIPALFYCPGRIAPAAIDTLCSQADIPPTLFDILAGRTARDSSVAACSARSRKTAGPG